MMARVQTRMADRASAASTTSRVKRATKSPPATRARTNSTAVYPTHIMAMTRWAPRMRSRRRAPKLNARMVWVPPEMPPRGMVTTSMKLWAMVAQPIMRSPSSAPP